MRTKGFSRGHVPVIALEMRGKGRGHMHSQKTLKINQFEDIDLMVRRHSLICLGLVPDLYESRNSTSEESNSL